MNWLSANSTVAHINITGWKISGGTESGITTYYNEDMVNIVISKTIVSWNANLNDWILFTNDASLRPHMPVTSYDLNRYAFFVIPNNSNTIKVAKVNSSVGNNQDVYCNICYKRK